MLLKLELWIDLPYDDGLHIPTIGIGIALQTKEGATLAGNLALVLRKIGVFAASDAGAPANETAAKRDLRYGLLVSQFAQVIGSHKLSRDPTTEAAKTSASEAALQTDLNALVALYDPSKTFQLNLAEAKEVKIEYILGYTIGPFTGAGAQADLDLRLAGSLAPAGQPIPHDTREYVALMSLYFNNPGLIGPGLRSALSSGNRAEAWYEIRYGSNSTKQKPSIRQGIAKRRYYESQLFGLYDDPSVVDPVDPIQAVQAYRMLELHRVAIEQYERQFSGQIAAANSSSGYQLAGTPNEVRTLDDSLQPAVQPLLDWTNGLLPAGSIQITSSMIDSPLGIHLSPGRSNASQQLSATYKATLDARRYTAPGSSTELELRNILVGEEGNDTLEGGKGDDVLLGGFGEDKYIFKTGDGQDIIVDQDGIAEIIRNRTQVAFGYKSGVDEWTQPGTAGVTVSLRKLGPGTIADLELVFTDSQTDKITLKNFDFAQAGADFYGIRLIDAPTLPAQEIRTFFGDKQDWDSDPVEEGIQTETDPYGNTVRADGQGDPARPDLAEADREDFFYGSDANEVERFLTAGGNDTVYADGAASTTSTQGGDDIVEAGAGSDVVAAGAGDDWIEGGTEGDILAGNEGNDSLFAESSNGGTLTIDMAIAQGESGEQRAGQGDLMSGDAGDDVLLSDAGPDFLAGGVGEEIIVGGAGDDTIYGDGTVTSALLGWSVARTRSDVDGVATFSVDWTGINLIRDDAAGGLDVIYGGAGADWIFTGAGDDYAEGGIGDDVLFGEAGHDVLLGGEGNDVLAGDSVSVDAAGLSGDDYLVGGAGDDELFGYKGNDYLDGGDGFDRLGGGDGDDTLVGGTGIDVLDGGAGKDTYVFNAGDGQEFVDDAPGGPDDPEASVLVLGPGIRPEDVKFRPESLLVDLGNGDSVQFLHFDPEDPLSTPVLDAIEFQSGGFMTFEDVLAQGFDIDGTPADDEIYGTAVTDRILAGDGNDYVDAKAGDDTIDGGIGDDEILAGEGDDTVTAGDGEDLVEGGLGDDTIDGGAGNDTTEGGEGADQLSGGEGQDLLFGQAGNDILNGDAGDDMLDGGTGNDTLSGGAGTDSYVIYGGMGTDVVTDGEGGETNVLQLGAGLGIENLKTAQVGDSLVVSLRGLNDSVTIGDYYTRPQNWVVRDVAGVETTMDAVINQPDPYAGDYIARLWADTRLGGIAQVFGKAYAIGWTPLDGDTFETYYERAYLSAVRETTNSTFIRVDPPNDILAQTTTTSTSSTVETFTGFQSLTFHWLLNSFEPGYLESDDAFFQAPLTQLPQTQSSGQALLTLKPDRELTNLNYQSSAFPGPTSQVSYDTGNGTVEALVISAIVQESYNEFADVTNVDLDTAGWPEEVNRVLGERVLANMTRVEDHYLSVRELRGGASDNSIFASNAGLVFPVVTLIDGGAGNDTLQGDGGLLYGNAGDDQLTGANAILIGGGGNDTITGWGGSTFIYTATEIGIDAIGDTAVATGIYLDWYYADLGIADWQESAEHGGEYRASVGDGGTDYFATLEEAQQSGGSDITFVEPLPVSAPVIRRSDTAALEALESAGVLVRDVATFGPGLALGDLALSIEVFGPSADAHPEEPWYGGGTLSVRWGSGAGFDVTVPDANYGLIGDDLFANIVDPGGSNPYPAWETYGLGLGIELFEFADGSRYTLEEVLQQAAIVRRYGYDFQRGSGAQVIEGEWTGVNFGADIAPSEVVAERFGQDLVFRLTDLSAEARVPGWYANPATIPPWEFRFADGTVFDTDTVTRLGLTQFGAAGIDFLNGDPQFASALYGLEGSDFLTGGNGNDLLDGGPGNDFVLEGLGGNDIYVFGIGYGEDTVSESFFNGGSGADTVRFDASVAPEDVSVDQEEGDLILTVGVGGDILRLSSWFDETGGTVEAIQFDNGTVWDAATVLAMLPAKDPATEGDDILWGGMGDDVLDGLGGNDEVAGFAGDDTLYGGSGDDFLDGSSGTDLVFAGDGLDWADAYGPGNDLLDLGAGDDGATIEDQGVAIGGAGDDWIEVYGSGAQVLFNAGDGNDTLYLDAQSFVLSLGGGVGAADLSLSYNGSEVTLHVGAADSILLTGDLFAGPLQYPDATLQLFGSAHLYDFGTLLDDYLALEAQSPGLVLQLDATLPSYEFASSETGALGGAIAWEYAMNGTLAALTEAQMRTVVSDPQFGLALQPMTLPSGNAAPQVSSPLADQAANEDLSFSFAVPAGTFSDPDAGDELTYSATLDDGSALPAWLSFDAGTQTFSGTPLQADVGAIDVKVAATDGGGLSAEDTFALTVANVNDVPVVSAADTELLLNGSTLAGALFSVFDEDGQSPTQYEFFDDVAGGGRFAVNGIEQGAGTAIPVSAADLANTDYVAGANPGTERVWVRAYDGAAWSAWKSWNMTSALHIPNAAPEATPTAATQTVLLDQSVAASSLFSVLDADGDPAARYEFWDSTAGNGYFALNGVEQAVNAAIVVSAEDLANTAFVGAAQAGSDQVWVRATDGQSFGAWKSWTMNSWPHATNAAPASDAPDGAVLRDQAVLAQSLFSVTDADGDAVAQYQFWDDTAGGGYFTLDGVPQTNNPIPVTAAQLAGVEYVGGADPGTEQVWVRANDGLEWGAWESWNMTTALHIPNAAPEATPAAATQVVLLAQAVSASALFSVNDADGDPVAQYEFWDSTAGNGYFAVNGVEQAVNVSIVVLAADLANTAFVGSAQSGSDTVWVRATDGQSFGAWESWTMNSWPHVTNAAPVAEAQNATLLTAETVAAASLFSVSDADGDAPAQYEFWDNVAGGGYWRLNGAQQAAAAAIAVDAADLATTEYVGGANPGSEQVWVRVNDGLEWGAWESWTMSTVLHDPNAAPVVTAANSTVLLDQNVAASTLFSVTDADEDVITQYELWDSTAGNGHFTVSGAEQGVNVTIGVTAAALADTQFAAASATGSDTVWVRAYDGMAWSDWKSWTMSSWPHLTNAAPSVSASNAGILRNEALSASMFFGVTDADGDAAVQYEFWDDVNGGGYWSLEGVQQASGSAIAVSAADLADLDYVGGANPGTEQVWVRASDGMGWSAWKNWLMATEGGMLRGGDGPDTLNGEAGPTVLQGGGGNDTLTDTDGDNLFSGGEGDDAMTGGNGDDLFAGGSGNDTIDTGAGNNIITYNAGGGIDTVYAAAGAANTLSFGGGIGYDDLTLSKDGNDLIVSAGENDQVVLKDWYAGSQSVLNLQIILDASDEFDANSADPLYNKKVQTFDFAGMVAEFDDALAQSPGLTSWAVTNALLQFHLSGADDMAIGGDLAYWYGKNNGFTGISLAAAQQVIGAAGFGSDAQSLQPFSGLQEGYVKLA
jgi:Ca2+-binding RTX toxin-like protein